MLSISLRVRVELDRIGHSNLEKDAELLPMFSTNPLHVSMASLFARVGHLEARLAAQCVQATTKRRRVERVCAQSTGTSKIQQRRTYGGDALNIPATGYSLQPDNDEEAGYQGWTTQQWGRKAGKAQRLRPFGLDAALKQSATMKSESEDITMDSADESVHDDLWQSFEQGEAGIDAETQADSMTAPETIRDTLGNQPLHDIDYASLLPQALANNEPELIVGCLRAAMAKTDLDFIGNLPRATFLECLRTLQPSNHLVPMANAQLEVSEIVAKQLGFAPLHEVAAQHATILLDMFKARRHAAPSQIGVAEYRVLLQSAQDLCDGYLAKRLWKWLHEDRVQPDTACYNSFMAANIWNGFWRSDIRQRLRFIPSVRKVRVDLGITTIRHGTDVLKGQVMALFSDMLEHGAAADEKTFRNIILAGAQAGDMALVKSILMKVWDVDVDALASGRTERLSASKSIPADSPLYPTSKTLFAVGHTFAVNNDIPMALRLVDFIARRYAIDIDIETWSHLFEWTTVLAAPRTGAKSLDGGARTGQLPYRSVLDLWRTMCGPPYHVAPTMAMYDQLIKNLQHCDSPNIMYEMMCEGRQLYLQSIADARKHFNRLQLAVDQDLSIETASESQEATLWHHASQPSQEELKRNFERSDLTRKTNMHWCKRWLRLLLSTLRAIDRTDAGEEWTLRRMPRFLWEWRDLAPSLVRYDTIGGVIEFNIRTVEEIKEGSVYKASVALERDSVLGNIPSFLPAARLRSNRGAALEA